MTQDWHLLFSLRIKDFLVPGGTILEVKHKSISTSSREIFADRCARWIGIDLASGPGVDLLLDSTRITEFYPVESFDAVISTEMLEHCRDWRKAILEMIRVLRPGGVLLLTTRSPGFEVHDYPADYWRFTSRDMAAIFCAVGEVLTLEDDMTLGFPCGVGIILRKSSNYDDKAFQTHLASIHPATVGDVSEQELEFQNVVLFDQHSRLSICSEIMAKLTQPGDTVLDVGCGPECLLGRYLPGMRMTYIDPLIGSLPFRSVHQIAGTLDSPEIQGQQFDHVVAIDVLEHIPAAEREGFVRKLTSLAKKNVILLFPSTDETEATAVDNTVNEMFQKVFGHEYPWLREHFTCGLPDTEQIKRIFSDLGWQSETHMHGNANMLAYLLPVILALWEMPRTKREALRISQDFIYNMGDLEKCPPFYRTCLVASLDKTPGLQSVFAHDGCASFDQRWRDYRFKTEVELHRIRVRLAKENQELMMSLAQERQGHAICANSLHKAQHQLMEMSDWASIMKLRLDLIYRIPLLSKAIRGYELYRQGLLPLGKAVAKKILPTWAVQRLRRLVRRKGISQVRESLTTNGGRAIVVFPIISWGMRWQRPQQLLSRLARQGYTVIYIAMGLFPRGSKYEDEQSALADVTFSKLQDNVFKIWLHSETQCSLYETCLKDGNLHNALQGLSVALKELAIKKATFLVQFPSWYTLAEPLREQFQGPLVFDCMDDHSGFGNTKPDALRVEEDLLRNADLVLASSDVLFERAKKHNNNVHLVNNGTEFEHFHASLPNGELDYLTDCPIVGYYGAIAEWFDVDLIVHCAKARPQWNFVLIGSTVGCDTEPLEQLPNVHLLGEKKYADLPGYLTYFTVCTIPFKLIPLILATNPVKFYEYLSCAKPVVSVALPELQPFADLCYLAQDEKDFLCKLDAAVAEHADESLIARRLDVARSNSWDARVESILTTKIFSRRKQ